MRVTAILNMKGGVGKTTTAVNMAAILARDHKARVLLIDADSQCNTTEFFGADPKGGNLADILRQKGPSDLTYAQTCIWKTQYPGVDVMPGDDSLMDLDLSKVEAGSVNANVLRLLTRAVAGRYDYILIDTSPSLGALNINAMAAADEVIATVNPQLLAMMGLQDFLKSVKKIKSRLNEKLNVAGILLTMCDARTILCKTITEQVAETFQGQIRIFESKIPNTVKVGESVYYSEPLIEYAPDSNACRAYNKLAGEVIAYEG